MRQKHKLKPGCFPYECEEKKLTLKRQKYATEVLHEEEEAAARVAVRGNQNPKVKNVSLWSIRKKIRE
jgi:hypothetical protein